MAPARAAPTDPRGYDGPTTIASDEDPVDDTVSAGEASGPPESPEGDEVDSGSGLFEASLSGTDDKDGKGVVAAAARRGWGVDLGGYVRGDVFVGKVPEFRQGDVKAAYGELALQIDVQKERYGGAHAEARLRYGQQGETRDLYLDLREAYVDLHVGPLDLRLGHQIIVWGRADAFNPTNNLTPIDLRIRSPIEDDRRLANVGARMFLTFAPVRIEGVWLPLYSPTMLPDIELDQYVVMGDPTHPRPELSNSLGAGRVHLELPAFEMSASYVYGHAPLPGLALQSFTVGEDPPEVRITRTAYDQHVAGLDFSTAIKDILAIRGEAAFRYPLRYENRVFAPRPDVQYALGVDREFGPVMIIAQYLGRYTLDWQREDGPDDPIDPADLSMVDPPLPPFLDEAIRTRLNEELASRNQMLFWQQAAVQHIATLRLDWSTLHDTMSVSALGMVNFTTQEFLIYPKLAYQISDHMSTAVGAEIYVGPAGTLLDVIEETLSAGYAEMRFSF